jgi:hypothetical protein
MCNIIWQTVDKLFLLLPAIADYIVVAIKTREKQKIANDQIRIASIILLLWRDNCCVCHWAASFFDFVAIVQITADRYYTQTQRERPTCRGRAHLFTDSWRISAFSFVSPWLTSYPPLMMMPLLSPGRCDWAAVAVVYREKEPLAVGAR